MSGNAWDSILKARPRQSPSSLLPPPPSPLQRLTLQPLFSRLSSTAIPWGPYLVQGDPGNTSGLPDRVARSPWSHRVLNPWTTLTWDVRYTLVFYYALCELNSGASEHVIDRDKKRRKFIYIYFFFVRKKVTFSINISIFCTCLPCDHSPPPFALPSLDQGSKFNRGIMQI